MDNFFQIYDEITPLGADHSWPARTGVVIESIGQALYQSMIVHLDMIKSRQGVDWYYLVDEARVAGSIGANIALVMKQEIDAHADVLSNISMRRNNIIAHRSSSLTFREVVEAHPVSKENLREVVISYYNVASDLHRHVPFSNIWQLSDRRTGIRAIIEAVVKPNDT